MTPLHNGRAPIVRRGRAFNPYTTRGALVTLDWTMEAFVNARPDAPHGRSFPELRRALDDIAQALAAEGRQPTEFEVATAHEAIDRAAAYRAARPDQPVSRASFAQVLEDRAELVLSYV